MMSRPDLWPERDSIGFHRSSAPELARPCGPGKPATRITKASDMYAFGMLTWEVGFTFPRNLRRSLIVPSQIFSGKSPFSGDLNATVICRVLKGDRPSRPGHAGVS